jgi:hypothetical protein
MTGSCDSFLIACVPSTTLNAAAIGQYQLLVSSWASNPRFVEAVQELVSNPALLATDDFNAKDFLAGKGFQLPTGATAEIKPPASGTTFDAADGGNISICVTIEVGGAIHIGCVTFQPPIIFSGM